MKSTFVNGNIETVENIFDDLTEGQGHDCQIVAPQTQDGYADEEADDGSQQTADEDGNNHQQNGVTDVLVQKGNGHNAGKSADAHKTGMAQAQLAQNAHGKVQGQGHDDIDADGNKLTAEAAAEDAVVIQKQNNGKNNHNADQRNDILPGGFRFP